MNYWKEIKEDPVNVWWYIQGEVRIFLWKYTPGLIREHIKEQFLYRARNSKDCLENGSCIICGCKTPDLYFANKACALSKWPTELIYKETGSEDPCYPKMMNKTEWLKFKIKNDIIGLML